MTLRRTFALCSRPSRHAALISLLAAAAAIGCSAPPGAGGDPDFDGPPDFSGPIGSAGTGGTTSTVPGAGGSGIVPSPNTPNGPVANGAGGTGQVPAGSAGAGQLPAGGSGGTSPAAGGASSEVPAGGSGQGGTGSVTLPEPPGEAFFFDDFESGAVGTQPAAWDSWINYSVEAGNDLGGDQFALLDDTDCVRGNQCVHFHATGATQPAMLTLPLPANTSRVYIRAFVKSTKQIGDQTPDQESNHETVIGLRATPNDGNFEIRFGGAKGALGFNMVGPGRSDAVAPGQALWGSAPAITPNQWHCVELAFINDNPASPQARASVDGTEVRAVTQLGDWHVPLSGEGTTWLNGMFKEVILGWQSFSPSPGNDLWMDDVVLSQAPIGCN